MMIAQQLYEGIELPGEEAPVGLITYMRTDSTRVSEQALDRGARAHRPSSTAPTIVPEKPNVYKTKTDAQDAHEAIRPTSMQYDPESVRAHLTPDQYYLYRLIWNRFVASQMPPATFDDTTVDITAADYLFRVKGSVPKFAGWLAVYSQRGRSTEREDRGRRARTPRRPRTTTESSVLPPLREGRRARRCSELKPEQKFTQPPPRYSEGDAGQGARRERHRPAEHLRLDHQRAPGARLREQDRRAVQADGPRPACSSTSCCSPAFDDILDVDYTRELEEDLDKIEKGKANYEETLDELLQEVQEGPEARREGDAQLQGRRAAGSGGRRATSAASRW